MTPHEFLEEIEDYCRRTGTATSRFGLLFRSRVSYVPDLRRRTSASKQVIEAGIEFMRRNPDGLSAKEVGPDLHSGRIKKDSDLSGIAVIQINEQDRIIRKKVKKSSDELLWSMMNLYGSISYQKSCTIHQAAYYCGMRP